MAVVVVWYEFDLVLGVRHYGVVTPLPLLPVLDTPVLLWIRVRHETRHATGAAWRAPSPSSPPPPPSLPNCTHPLLSLNSVFACKTNSTECDPQPLTHSWKTNTSAPVTSIVSFPDSLTPSEVRAKTGDAVPPELKAGRGSRRLCFCMTLLLARPSCGFRFFRQPLFPRHASLLSFLCGFTLVPFLSFSFSLLSPLSLKFHDQFVLFRPSLDQSSQSSPQLYSYLLQL